MIEEIGESSKPQETGNSVPTEEPQNKPAQTPNTKSRQYDFDSAKEKLDNIQAAITNSPSEETKGLVGNVYDARERITELKDGTFKRSYDETVLNLNSKLNKVNSQMTDLIADKEFSSKNKELIGALKKNFIDNQAMDEVVTESKFNIYRKNFNKIKQEIVSVEGNINKNKKTFKELGIDVNSKEMRGYFGKIEEAKKEYSRSIKEQNEDRLISGEKPQKTKQFTKEERANYIAKKVSERNNYIAEKVFGDTEYSTNKMDLIKYYENNKKLERLKEIKGNLGSKIKGMMDKDGNFSYKKAVESSKSMGWKGKAAIFGGVALGALSLVGVANMAMSGGRQSNSNLYNPYQAMY